MSTAFVPQQDGTLASLVQIAVLSWAVLVALRLCIAVVAGSAEPSPWCRHLFNVRQASDGHDQQSAAVSVTLIVSNGVASAPMGLSLFPGNYHSIVLLKAHAARIHG